MTRPGTAVIQSSTPPVRSAPTDTGVAFIALPAQRGTVEATSVRSMTEFARVYGERVAWSYLYDVLDVAFREGLNEAYIARVTGPSARAATTDLLDADSAVSLRVSARSAGDWGESIRVEVAAGSTSGYKLIITYRNVAGVVSTETADNLTTQQAAVDWARTSSLVSIALGAGSRVPRTSAATALTNGDDDLANIRDDHYRTALTKFTKDLGPGQVAIPGRTTAETHAMLEAHRVTTGRAAVLDYADTPTIATLKQSTVSARSVDGADNAAGFAPWVIVPGLLAGTTRTVPPSALVLGRIADTDAQGSANVPAAGLDAGVSRYALGLTQTYSDADFEDASLNGVNIIRDVYGAITIFGWRTVVDPNVDDTWIQFSHGRFFMQLTAQLDQVALRHVFRVIDGGLVEIGKFHRDIVGVLLPFYESGDLYGASPEEAFAVDTITPNTPETIANGELHAVVSVRLSPFAEWVVINVNKSTIEGSVA